MSDKKTHVLRELNNLRRQIGQYLLMVGLVTVKTLNMTAGVGKLVPLLVYRGDNNFTDT